MWTMLVGMMTWFFFLGFLIAWKIAFTAGFYFAARRNKMKTVHWTVAGLLLDIWTLIPYFYAKKKMSFSVKCGNCGALPSPQDSFCTLCGTKLEKYDDGRTAVRFLLAVGGAYVAFVATGTLISFIFSL